MELKLSGTERRVSSRSRPIFYFSAQDGGREDYYLVLTSSDEINIIKRPELGGLN